MITDVLLVLNAVLLSFYAAGHLFDLLAVIPNWESGEVSSVVKLRDFFSKSSPKNYFIFFVPFMPLLSLGCLIMVWGMQAYVPLYIGLSFILTLGVGILTLGFFVPINKYMFENTDYDPVLLKKRVKKWVRMDYLRLFMLLVGMLAAVIGMYKYLTIY